MMPVPLSQSPNNIRAVLGQLIVNLPRRRQVPETSLRSHFGGVHDEDAAGEICVKVLDHIHVIINYY